MLRNHQVICLECKHKDFPEEMMIRGQSVTIQVPHRPGLAQTCCLTLAKSPAFSVSISHPAPKNKTPTLSGV